MNSTMKIVFLFIVIFALFQGFNCNSEEVEETEEAEGNGATDMNWIIPRLLKLFAQSARLVKDVVAEQELAKGSKEPATPASH